MRKEGRVEVKTRPSFYLTMGHSSIIEGLSSVYQELR